LTHEVPPPLPMVVGMVSWLSLSYNTKIAWVGYVGLLCLSSHTFVNLLHHHHQLCGSGFHEGEDVWSFFGHFLSRFSRVSNVHMFCILLLLWSSSTNIKTIMTFLMFCILLLLLWSSSTNIKTIMTFLLAQSFENCT
jgi:hypothetical protein